MHVWASIPEKLASFGLRLRAVLIENRNAIAVMKDHDTPQTLHYVDPPYVHDTRKIGWSAAYRHELTDEQHGELLDALLKLDGMVVLSGYPNELYDAKLRGWQRTRKTSQIVGKRGSITRTEVLWMNPACAALNRAPQLFEEAA